MTQSPGAPRSLADIQRSIAALQRRALDHVQHSIGLVLNAMDRRRKARELAWRQAHCTKAGCRRARGCRGAACGCPPASPLR